MQTSRMLVRNQVCRITIWCVFNKPCLERIHVPLVIFLLQSGISNILWLCNSSFLWQGIIQHQLRSALCVSNRSVVMRAIGISFKLVQLKIFDSLPFGGVVAKSPVRALDSRSCFFFYFLLYKHISMRKKSLSLFGGLHIQDHEPNLLMVFQFEKLLTFSNFVVKFV